MHGTVKRRNESLLSVDVLLCRGFEECIRAQFLSPRKSNKITTAIGKVGRREQVLSLCVLVWFVFVFV